MNPTGSMENCGHVIEAVEARIRGTDPEAQARAGGNLYATSKTRADGTRYKESLGDQYDSHWDSSTEPQIARSLAARGEGAQGVVFVEWLKADGTAHDFGHFFNAVRKNGNTFSHRWSVRSGRDLDRRVVPRPARRRHRVHADRAVTRYREPTACRHAA